MLNNLNVKELISLFKKKWKIITIIVFIFSCIGAFAANSIGPIYEARTDLLVNYRMKSDDSNMLETNEIDTSLRLIETYKYVLKSDRTLSEVIPQLKIPYKKKELKSNISIESINNSQVITIISQEKTPEIAAELANTYASVFQEEIKTLMNLDNINILNVVSPDTDVKEIKPSKIIYGIISLIFGLIVAILIVLVQEYYYAKLNTEVKTESALKIPSMGSIPIVRMETSNKSIDNKWNGKKVTSSTSSVLFKEEFRRIRANVQFRMTEENVKSILVTSPVMGDGKSFISGNLAIIMAMAGKKTIFIDGDLRTPTGRGFFNLPKRMGLTSYISNHNKIDEIIQKTETKNLSFISAGPIPFDSAEILSSDKMKHLIEKLKEEFDVIIIDTPSLVVADAISLSTFIDGCLCVVDAERTKEEQANKSIEQLKKVGAPILGTILNKGYSSTKAVT